MTTRNMTLANNAKPVGYSRLQISLHWIIAALVIFQLFFGESMTHTVDAVAEGTVVASTDTWLAWFHYWFGIAILAIVALRLFVRLKRGVPTVRADTLSWTDQLDQLAHGSFYVLLVAVPVTGLPGYYVEVPFGDIHAWAKPVLIGLIAVHAAVALYHHFWKKNGTLARILRSSS